MRHYPTDQNIGPWWTSICFPNNATNVAWQIFLEVLCCVILLTANEGQWAHVQHLKQKLESWSGWSLTKNPSEPTTIYYYTQISQPTNLCWVPVQRCWEVFFPTHQLVWSAATSAAWAVHMVSKLCLGKCCTLSISTDLKCTVTNVEQCHVEHALDFSVPQLNCKQNTW